jgi:hypothetical protein
VCYIDYIVNLKKFLVKNHLSDFNQTCQDCSVGEGLPKLFKELNSMQKSGCHGKLATKRNYKKGIKRKSSSKDPQSLEQIYFA